MKDFLKTINNQDGSMILLALMLLVILTIMGITSTTTSIVENRIAVNEQLHKMAFYNSDSGIYATAKIVGATIDEGDSIPVGSYEFEYADQYNDDFYEHITDLDDYDGGIWDLRFVLGNGEIRTDIEPLGRQISGSPVGVVEGLGGSGAAARGAQEISVYYRIFSEGKEQVTRGEETRDRSISTLSATYEKILNVPGGL